MEHFYRRAVIFSGAPNLLAQNLPIVKPSYPNSGLYPQTSYLSNLYSLKDPIQNAPKCPINLQKTRKKYIKGLIISRKPGKKVCLFVMYYTRGFGISFVIPRKKRRGS
jgi:hypothetical protein